MYGNEAQSSIQQFDTMLLNTGSYGKKLSIIKNYPIREDKEEIFAFIQYISEHSRGEESELVLKAWDQKLNQCYQKGLLVIKDANDLVELQVRYDKTRKQTRKEKFYHKTWFLIICGVFLPIVGIILLWTIHRDKSNAFKIGLTVAFSIWALTTLGYASTGKNNDKNMTPAVAETTSIETETKEVEESIEEPASDVSEEERKPVKIDEKKTEADVKDEEIKQQAAKPEDRDNQAFIKKYEYDIVTAAKLVLDRFIVDYDMSLAPQNWVLSMYDETDTVVAITDIVYGGKEGRYFYVGTLNINEEGKVVSATPHYVYVIDTVYGDDGYCKDFLDNINALNGAIGNTVDSFEEYLRDELSKSAKMQNTVYSIGDTIYANAWVDGLSAEVIAARMAEGTTPQDWVELRNSVVTAASAQTNEMKNNGLNDMHLCMNIVSDVDQTVALLSTYDGELVFDFMETDADTPYKIPQKN